MKARRIRVTFNILLLAAPLTAAKAQVKSPSPASIAESSAITVLKNVRIVDGTGTPSQENQTLVINGAKIRAVGPTATVTIPEGARTLDLSGRTILPGLVLLHEHLFSSTGALEVGHSLPFTAPRLLLAYGATTFRTAGSSNPYMDLNLKQQIDLGQVPGPEMFVTSPILNGPGSKFLDGKVIRSEEDARRSVRYWAAEGVTSFKVYRQITKQALAAIIDEAHRLGVPVTAHLQSVSCRDAVELGIDNLEHGFGPCFSADKLETDPAGPRAQALIRTLVDKKVTITLTPGALFFSRLSDRELDFLDPGVRERYLREQSGRGSASSAQAQRVLEIAGRFDLAFAKAGGRLVLGSDANCCSLGHFAGASGKFALESLVREGFSPLEAIRIATLNGAMFLGIADRTGTIAAGKEADLLVVRGDPSARIEDIEYIETVWSNGLDYDPKALLAQVKGEVGWR